MQIGKGADNGILIRDAESLETAYRVDTVVLDKTGTITKGRPEVTDVFTTIKSIDDNELLRIAASVERGSEHPRGEAILAEAGNRATNEQGAGQENIQRAAKHRAG